MFRTIASICIGRMKSAPRVITRGMRALRSQRFVHAANCPIVAGGTGLYLRALLEGLAPAPQRDDVLRDRLRSLAAAKGSQWLHRILQRLDARAAAQIHANDVPKLIRSIEVSLAGRKPQTAQWETGREPLQGYDVIQFALNRHGTALSPHQ